MKGNFWRKIFRKGWNSKDAIYNGWNAKHDGKSTRTKLKNWFSQSVNDNEWEEALDNNNVTEDKDDNTLDTAAIIAGTLAASCS